MDVNPLFEDIFLPQLDTDAPDTELQEPFGEFIERAQLEAELRKGCGEPPWDEIVAIDSSSKVTDADIDLSKASSGPGRIRLERTVIDGEVVIEKYNSRGENVGCYFLND